MITEATCRELGIDPASNLGRSMRDVDWAPAGGTSLAEFHRIADDLEIRWHRLFADRVATTPDLNGRFLEYDGRGGQMPWVWWAGDEHGGYWVGHGLEHRLETPADQLRGWHWLHYLRSSPDGARWDGDEHIADMHHDGRYARDLELHADLLIAWLLAHRRTLS